MRLTWSRRWIPAASTLALLLVGAVGALGASSALAQVQAGAQMAPPAAQGSTLTFWTESNRLKLRVRLPVKDLVVAAPSVDSLNEAAAPYELSLLERLSVARYLISHLDLTKGRTRLSLTLEDAVLHVADKDLGPLSLLDVELTASLPRGGRIFPLTLVYDAVMHEVRDHRATVYWQPQGMPAQQLAEFGYRTFNAEPRPVILNMPEK